MNKIAQFEALAERLVEGTFARLFAGRPSSLEVATHLARAMEDYRDRAPRGEPQIPNHYWVYLCPDDCRALAADQQSLEAELARHVVEMAAQAGHPLPSEPMVHVASDDRLDSHDVRVEARWISEEGDEIASTREMERAEGSVNEDETDAGTENGNETENEYERQEPAQMTEPPSGRPFLILEGKRHVNLLKPVVSLGRALDNDVILEDPRISRHHAQLRQRYGRYVLYDLGSSGGTLINGYPIEECVLHSGDVISLAGVQVIYGEDPPTPIPLPDAEGTPPLGFRPSCELDG